MKNKRAFPLAKLGSKVSFMLAYPVKCQDRFYPGADGKTYPKLIEGYREAKIIGANVIIVRNYRYHSGGIDEQSSATGTRELCYLVREKLRSKAMYVREIDVIALERLP